MIDINPLGFLWLELKGIKKNLAEKVIWIILNLHHSINKNLIYLFNKCQEKNERWSYANIEKIYDKNSNGLFVAAKTFYQGSVGIAQFWYLPKNDSKNHKPEKLGIKNWVPNYVCPA